MNFLVALLAIAWVPLSSHSSDRSFSGCPLQEIELEHQDPVDHKSSWVKAHRYLPRKNESASTVIILPPTGGANLIDRGYANLFCSSNLNVILVLGWRAQDEVSLDPVMHDNGARRALAALKTVLGSSAIQGPVGLLGTSIGAITGALALGTFPELKAAALITGSTRFAEVVAVSTETTAQRLREERMKAWGIESVEEYRELLLKRIETNPRALVGQSGPKRVYAISASRDSTVPSLYQFELAELWGAERHVVLDGDHFYGITRAYLFERYSIAEFFQSALGTDPAVAGGPGKTSGKISEGL